MKYMLLIYGDENALNESERQACYVESVDLCHDIQAKGQYLGASPLHHSSRTTSVQVRNGHRTVTDGPYIETREQLGGYFLVDVASHEEAVEIAGRIPGARGGTIEVRPIVELDNLPEEG